MFEMATFEHVDNTAQRQVIWNMVYAQVFASTFLQNRRDASRMDTSSPSLVASLAADDAIRNIPSQQTVMTASFGK